VLSAQHLRAHTFGPRRRPSAIEEPTRLPEFTVREHLRLDGVLAVVAEFHAIPIAVLGKLDDQFAWLRLPRCALRLVRASNGIVFSSSLIRPPRTIY